APVCSMIRVVFRSVEIGVHPSGGAESENGRAMLHGPGRAEEAFDDAATLECARTMHHLQLSHGRNRRGKRTAWQNCLTARDPFYSIRGTPFRPRADPLSIYPMINPSTPTKLRIRLANCVISAR